MDVINGINFFNKDNNPMINNISQNMNQNGLNANNMNLPQNLNMENMNSMQN